MNQSEIEAEIHTLRDGGLLMQARYFNFFMLFCKFIYFYLIMLHYSNISIQDSGLLSTVNQQINKQIN